MLRRRLGEIAYAVTDAPVALVGFAVSVVLFTLGAALLVIVVGVPVLASALVFVRSWGRFERARARLLGVRLAAAEVIGWRAAIYLVVKLPLALLTTALAVAVCGVAGGALSYPAWFAYTPIVFGSYQLDTPWRVVAVVLVGLVALVAGPLLLAGPLRLSRLAVRGLLGPSRVGALEQARAQAVNASVGALRRIERDLHDGTQARLVTLAMDLSHARELLAGLDLDTAGPDADRLRSTVDAAHRNAQQAIIELRDLVRGIHPPVLDTGLGPALASLTSAVAVPVALSVRLPHRPAPAIESIAYFCVAELLANVVKHSNASTSAVDVQGNRGRLRLRVTDDGVGGADLAAPGHVGGGLAGLVARVGPVDGTLAVNSPLGGPTIVTIELPLTV